MSQALINQLTDVVGSAHIQTQQQKTEYYRSGFRSGRGEALAVIFPQNLLQLWQVLKACVAANSIVIMQAAKTGLTEGSTPKDNDYDREVVVINTLAMNPLVLLNNGEQVLSFPGTTLHTLEKALQSKDRTPHSVIGSSCLGASVVGGIANNSGGALVKRGPAYTEMALFARVNEKGELELVNHLGIELGDDPETMIANLESQSFDKNPAEHEGQMASDREYIARVRDVDADTPARFNADKRRLYEASGCAGKLAVFAVRLDTFPVAKEEKTFYIGTNDPKVLTQLRRDILKQFENIPEVGEYLHRDIFNISEKYGKDTFLTIQYLGTDWLPRIFAIKGRTDAVLNKVSFLPSYLSDRIFQLCSKIFPQHLPKRLLEFRDKYEHHLILKMSDAGIAEAEEYLESFFSGGKYEGAYFTCTPDEAKKAYLHRFAAAGSAIRYQTVHEKELADDILALDIALRRNEQDWVEKLPESISSQIEHALYYGHFMCHVFHQDYILKKGANPLEVKKQMLALLDSRGAKYPAEHNVGHLYEAESDLKNFYQELDPTNTFNPGIGKMGKHKRNCNCGL